MVLVAALALFGVWMTTHWGRLTGDPDALIRFVLGAVFAAAIILRRKNSEKLPFVLPRWIVPLVLVAGTFAALGGIIFKLHIVEWIGILMLLLACSVWISPIRFGPDLLIAFVILFWMHPLPGQLFGWLQANMQRLSVMGAEFILHAANVRVWGDGMVLRTGYQNFMVPESCSGMRTAVTVFLCTLGVGVLLRLKWFETIAFVLLGLAQVLLLNIARISFMVLWAPRMPPEWASTFLHDSLAIFLMGAILIVQLEASWWFWWSRRRQRIKEGILNRELEAPDKASIVPHSLRRLGFVLAILLSLSLIVFGVFGIVYKARAHHRKEMIREVADGLMESDPIAADSAIKAALALVPGDSTLLSMQARNDLVRGRFEEGLAILVAKEAAGKTLSLEETILQSWALMRMGRSSEAKVIIDALPSENDQIPGVAMLKAEFAAMDNRSEDAARYVLLASRSYRMLGRIRSLFPYLALHEQWEAIAKSDQDQPYAELHQALIVIHANHRVGDLTGVAKVMSQAIKVWPDDPRFLKDLYRLAEQRQGSEWEARFERNVRANVSRLSVDMLVMVQDYSWRIVRPDLAWIAFCRLQHHDAADPALLVAPARYGGLWCRFRRHQLNVEAESAAATLDLRPVIESFATCGPFRGFVKRIPLLSETGRAADPAFRKDCFVRCLEELAVRETEAPLSNRLLRLYPMVLAMSDRYDEAHARLDRMLELYPNQKDDIVFQHGVFYDQQAKWQESYEALRHHSQVRAFPNLTADLLLIKAMMHLDLGVCAMDVMQRARLAFPGSLRLDLAESAIWDVFGFKEQALAVMSRSASGANSPSTVALLHETGRRNAARTLSDALGIPLPRRAAGQKLSLPSATWTLKRRWPPPMDATALGERIVELESRIELATSPFIKDILSLELETRKSEVGTQKSEDGGRRSELGTQNSESGTPNPPIVRTPLSTVDTPTPASPQSTLNTLPSTVHTQQLERWESIGRDDCEKMGALYQLAMLAARAQRYELADAALGRCLELFPESLIVWRARIALTEGDPTIVSEAYAKCPNDPEIWLANLVVNVQIENRKSEIGSQNPEDRTQNPQPPPDTPPSTVHVSPPTSPQTPNALLPSLPLCSNTPNPGPGAISNIVSTAISDGTFSPGTLVRAGDYLLSQRQPALAAALAKAAIPESRGLLAAHVLGLRTALVLGDARWAQACAINGIENAQDPTPFYKTLVDIKIARRQVDNDLLVALEYLQDQDDAEPRWAESLGRVYFEKGDMRRALSIFGSVIEGDTKGVSIQTLILAAEAARRNSKTDRAISILEAAYSLQPERLSVLNNLIYLLAQNPKTLSRARALMPQLLNIGSDSFAVMDTAAVVYLKSGDLKNAKVWMEKAMKALDNDNYSAKEVRLNAAELQARRGEFEGARQSVEELRRDTTRTDFIDQKARGLLREIQSLER